MKRNKWLSVVNDWQLREINAANSAELSALQESFITRALSEGKETYNAFLAGEHHDCREADTFLAAFQKHQTTATTATYLTEPDLFATSQQELYELIHHNAVIPDHLKLFFEFLLGLVRCDLSIQVQYQLFVSRGWVSPDHLSAIPAAPFFERLDQLGGLLTELNAVITREFVAKDRSEQYWVELAHSLNGLPPLKTLTEHLASMQTIPDNTTIVTIAQVLHWKGWGGDGAILQKHFGEDFPALLAHCIHYISDSRERNFAHLMAGMSVPMSQRVFDVMISYFQDNRGPLRISDIGSGPRAVMVRQSVLELRKTREVELHAFDICAPAMDPELPRTTFYLDANLHQGAFGNPPGQKLYDAVCAGLVIHQLVYHINTLKSMVEWTKPGGGVFIVDVRASRHLQCAVIPVNLVDREGFVPDYPFWDYSVVVKDTAKVKFPYPLYKADIDLPAALVNAGSGSVWGARFFVVLEATPDQLADLQQLWTAGKFEASDQLANAFTGSCVVSTFYDALKNKGVTLGNAPSYAPEMKGA